MKKTINVLIVQFRKDVNKIENEQLAFNKILKKTDHQFVSVFNNRTDIFSKTQKTLNNFTHIFLGGSSEFGLATKTTHPEEKKIITGRLKKLVNTAIDKDHPLLGICYGHHLIAYIHGAKISRPRSQKELGGIEVKLTGIGVNNNLFTKMGNNFPALTAHIESVSKKTMDMEVLASTQRCKITAYKIKNNIYGLQFHPELDQKMFRQRINMGNQDNDNYQHYYKTKKTNTSLIIKNFLNT